MPRSRMEKTQKRLSTSCCKIRRLRLWMHAAQRMVVILFGFNAHENARTSAAARNNVSRISESRLEFRGNFLHRRADHWNFLPAHLYSEKAGARERRFFCDAKRCIGERLSAVFALPSTRSKCAAAETNRAPAFR